MESLDLQIDVGAGGEAGYEVRARVGGSEALSTMRLPLPPAELQALLRRMPDSIIASAAKVRRSTSNQERPVQQLGALLFERLLAGNVRGLLVASRHQAAREGRQLRLVLQLRPAELAYLPWEFLFDASEDDYICLNTPLIRRPSDLEAERPLQVDPPLRILGMVARPGDQQALAVDDEKRRLSAALAELERDGRIKLAWAEGQTWRTLQDAMRHGPWHVFHFIGHGGFDATNGEGTLALTDDLGRTHPLPASGLAMLLRGHRSLRLVVLNACDTGRASVVDPFSSVAGALVRRGIPAVVAMQFEITDDAAVEFSRTFYGAVANQLPLDVSVTEARQAIQLSNPGTLEWGTPVLYLRSPDGYIFEVAGTDSGSTALALLYDDGLAAFAAERWPEASEAFRRIVARNRDYQDAAARLEQAVRWEKVASRYEVACTAADARLWDEAIADFEALRTIEPDYRDARARLDQAYRERDKAELRAKAKRSHSMGEWEEVLAVVGQLRLLDPDARDLDALASSARAELAAADKQRQLAGHYADGLAAVRARAWDEAIAHFAALLSLQADYRDARTLLDQARNEVARARAASQLVDSAQELLRRHKYGPALSKSTEVLNGFGNSKDPAILAYVERADELGRQAKNQLHRRRWRWGLMSIAAAIAVSGLVGWLLAGTGRQEWTVKVPATQAWTTTAVHCKTGYALDITATGTVYHDSAHSNGPDGDPNPSYREYNVDGLRDANHAGLIGSLDRHQPYFPVGERLTYTCPAAGRLFLGINDQGPVGNSGTFTATISERKLSS